MDPVNFGFLWKNQIYRRGRIVGKTLFAQVMYRFLYRNDQGKIIPFHTIADSFAEAISNFIETTGKKEQNIESITYIF